MRIDVFNLDTYSEQVYVGIGPREAVIAAYAQDRGDWNTADYEKKYGPHVKKRGQTWSLGAFAAVERFGLK